MITKKLTDAGFKKIRQCYRRVTPLFNGKLRVEYELTTGIIEAYFIRKDKTEIELLTSKDIKDFI